MGNRNPLEAIRNPAQLVLLGFVLLILSGALLLSLPFATDPGVNAPGFRHMLFWSTSASTVTGLATVDISIFSLFGELVLLALIQIGGFGIMTVGSVLAIAASKRLGLRQRMLAQAEIGATDMGELRSLILGIAKVTIGVESVIALVLFVRFATGDEVGVVRSAYLGIFHAISAFNNAGIGLASDNLVSYGGDPFVILPISFAFVLGGLGFPVFMELGRRVRHRRWTLHTKLTVYVTALFLTIGPLFVLIAEWNNQSTLGPMGVFDKLLAAWFQGSAPRTAGFNTIGVGELREPTLNFSTALMFIGGGSASTAGGIKVTTFAVLGYAMWAEVRGDEDVNVFRRRLPTTVVRQAMTVACLSIGIVFATATALTAVSGFSLNQTLYEATSAFGTVGLSTGITGILPASGQYLLIVVMLLGRVGPVTFATALALQERRRAYRFSEDRPLIG
ncbi:MAG TPA: potassium transporter TrkG [Ilumatobacter sp.]|nr:potassium transporter TrkG [Ilumatobacter sp.]